MNDTEERERERSVCVCVCVKDAKSCVLSVCG
jgi:hypothetical protein